MRRTKNYDRLVDQWFHVRDKYPRWYVSQYCCENINHYELPDEIIGASLRDLFDPYNILEIDMSKYISAGSVPYNVFDCE